MSGKATPKYTKEFKKTIVNLYQSGKTYSQISQEYGISHSALANWINLPKMSTVKPFKHKSKVASDGECKNILSQKFNQPAPNKVWVCDFTYIRVAGRFYYLCAILDLFSRKVIAYKLSGKIDTRLAIDTVNAAVAARGKSEGIIFSYR